MIVQSEADIKGLKKIGQVVSTVLAEMKQQARPGMTTLELDQIGAGLLKKFGARSAPILTYNFPGHTCISLNHEAAHGIPSSEKVIQAGDLINIDVSAELDGYFGDTGHSFQIEPAKPDIIQLCHQTLQTLKQTIAQLKPNMPINQIGKSIEKSAHRAGYRVVKNLCSHGVGKALHEDPSEIHSYYLPQDKRILKEGMVITLEPFLSTGTEHVIQESDGWTLTTPDGSYTAQHEHTMMITQQGAVVLTELPE